MTDPIHHHDVLIVGRYASGSGMMAGATFGRIAGTNASGEAKQ